MRLDEVGDLMLVNRIRRFVRCCSDGWVFFFFFNCYDWLWYLGR